MLDISFADTFEVTTRDYSRPNAYWLGTAARLCYHDPATIQAAVAAWGLTEFQSFDKLETQAYIAGNEQRADPGVSRHDRPSGLDHGR